MKWLYVFNVPGEYVVVRLGVMYGDYHWRKHGDEEFLFILEGKFLVDLRNRIVTLRSREGFVAPRVTAMAFLSLGAGEAPSVADSLRARLRAPPM